MNDWPTEISIHLISASPTTGQLEPITVYDRWGVHVCLHFCRDGPPARPDVAVVIVSSVNTSALSVSDVEFQVAVPKVHFFFLFSLGCRCESALSHSGLVRVFTSHVFNLCYFESDSPLQWCQLTLNWAAICVWPKMTQRWLSISHAYLSCVHFGLVLTRRVVVSQPGLILMTHICLTTRVAVAESYVFTCLDYLCDLLPPRALYFHPLLYHIIHVYTSSRIIYLLTMMTHISLTMRVASGWHTSPFQLWFRHGAMLSSTTKTFSVNSVLLKLLH